MPLTIDDIIQDAGKLPLVPLAGSTAYQEHISLMTQHVDETLTANPSIHDLIGNNPPRMMYDNHKHHAAFMSTVFCIGNYELLVRTILWVYRAYSAHKFSYDYFPVELRAWIEALEKNVRPELNGEMKSIYTWMIENHAEMIELSKSDIHCSLPISEDWLETKNSFLAAILDGDHRKCLEIAGDSISSGADIEPFYMHIIQPVMYEIGMLWERGDISVAQEHLASAIVSRVLASTSMLDVVAGKTKGKVVVTAAPNEYHEIGAWMISDILEHDGWHVKHLGANTPMNDLLGLLRSFQPDVLALSVTMPFNILKAREIVEAIKGDEELNGIKVIVGGRAFNETADLWRSSGADSFAANAQEFKTLLRENVG